MNQFLIEYYTDPLCCWSWAMEPQMRKLRYLLKDRLKINYIMGGLIKDWKHYSDDLNNVKLPSQLGPLWMEARLRSGQPIIENMWFLDPVDTSYPACMAVKAAETQSFVAGEAMLRSLREAVMINSKNIGDSEVLLELASSLEQKGILNKDKFEQCLFSDEAPNLFQKDLDIIKLREISRFPTLLITLGDRTVQITGYRPFSVLVDTFKLLDPHLKINHDIDKQEYINSWEYLTKRELEEVLAQDSI